MSDKNHTPENRVNFEKAIFINNSPSYLNNGGFFTAFSAAIQEVAQNRNLKILDLRLLLLILSYMGDPKIAIPGEPNKQRLLPSMVYARDLGYNSNMKGNITRSFQRIEEEGYFKRNKESKELEILINPSMAYNGKTKNFTKTWNQLALLFGNEPRKVKDSEEEEEQDWDSHMEKNLNQKKYMKQHNINGDIDDVEIV